MGLGGGRCREEEARSSAHRGSQYSGYSYANPSLRKRHSAARQTMAVEPESLACSLPGPERHVRQGADTNGGLLQHPEARLQGGAPGGVGNGAKVRRERDETRSLMENWKEQRGGGERESGACSEEGEEDEE